MATSNEKACVTKEQNEKHRKVLEALMKRPENKECADCRSKGPRWASVNLGIFVCIQCSGIHRSLGVDISKVRSVTLDTWLPEQVAFMQNMGNEKANQVWEADLPPNFRRPGENDRSGLETFIRSKYEAKRFVHREQSPPPRREERRSSRDGRRASREGTSRRAAAESERDGKGEGGGRHGRHDGGRERRASEPSTDGLDRRESSARPSAQHAGASPPPTRGNNGVATATPRIPFPGGASPATASASQPAAATQTRTPLPESSPQAAPKAEPESDLFDLLSISDSAAGGAASTSSAAGEDSWTTFQSAAQSSSSGRTEAPFVAGSDPKSESRTAPSGRNSVTAGLEELFEAAAEGPKAAEAPPAPAPRPPPSADVRKDILSLFETPSSVSPFMAHQQQVAAAMAERQAQLMSAGAAATGVQGLYYDSLQQLNAPKIDGGNPASGMGAMGGQFRPVGVPVAGSMINPSDFANRGVTLVQGAAGIPFKAPGNATGPAFHNYPATGVSLPYGNQAGPAPFGNGLFSSVDLNSSAGTSATSHSPAPSQPLSASGNTYDFSSLTANAFSTKP